VIFGSVCSGIEAASVAWGPLGWRCAFMSEIDTFPRAVLAHHYPEVPLHGDFTTIKAGDYEPIDVLVGGTPCQSFSVAGLRAGLADPRGNLMLGFGALADRLRPRWVVWENVPGVLSSNGGRDFGAFLGMLAELGYGFAYRVLDAQYFGLAQRRRRVFVVGYLGDWRRAAAVFFERESLSGNPPPRREKGQGFAASTQDSVAKPLGAKRDGGWRGDLDNDTYAIQERAVSENPDAGPQGKGFQESVAYTLEARHHVQSVAYGGNNTAGPIDVATACNAHSGRQDFESETFIAHTLKGEGFDASEDGTGRGVPLGPTARAIAQNQRNEVREMDIAGALASEPGMKQQTYVHQSPAVAFQYKASASNSFNPTDVAPSLDVGKCDGMSTFARGAVRRLTPKECCRLQGFPDDYLDITYRGKPAADGPRYKALGNSMAVPVMRWIGERIELVEVIQ